MPSRLVTVLEGETLLNDTTALVTFRAAVAATVAGTFSLLHAAGAFLLIATGGVVVGLAIGWLLAQLRKRADA